MEALDGGLTGFDGLGSARWAITRYFHSFNFAVCRYLCDLLRSARKD